MNKKIDSLALGYSGAILSSFGMLILWVFGSAGYYTGAVVMMEGWHMFFSLSLLGLVGGIIEAAAWSFIFLYVFGIMYNKLTK